MMKITGVLVAGVLCVTLSGCMKNCDDCDDVCEAPKPKRVASAAGSECVPAPAPMGSVTSSKVVEKSPESVVATNPNVVQPAPKVVDNKVPAKIEKVVEVRRAEPVAPPRLRRYFAGEIEIDDL